MDWPDLVSEGLPPPRSDEPVRLRQDIADELADHLACALSRERRRADDETAARRAVLDRFGDPKAIARRLWFDAMKEIIMRERLVLVLAGVLLITVLVGGLLTWQSMKLNREVNQAILAKLDSMNAPAARAEVPENWSKAKIRLVRGSPDGPPIKGTRVELLGKAFDDTDKTSLEATTDDQGVAMFGPVRPGKYGIRIGRDPFVPLPPDSPTAPCPFSLGNGAISLYPGQSHDLGITCPDAIDRCQEVSFRLAGPAGPRDGNMLFRCHIEPDPNRLDLGSNTWWLFQAVLDINMSGEVVAGLVDSGSRSSDGRTRLVRGKNVARRLSPWPLSTQPTATLAPVKYRLISIEAWIPGDHYANPTAPQQEWLAAGTIYLQGHKIESAFASKEPPASASPGPSSIPSVEPGPDTRPSFVVKPRGENCWTIEIPPALIAQAAQAKIVLEEERAAREQDRLATLEKERKTAEQKEAQAQRKKQQAQQEKTPTAESPDTEHATASQPSAR